MTASNLHSHVSGPLPHAAAHTVQFYEDEAFLYRTVADFLAPGLKAGQPAVVIATQEHIDAFSQQLIVRGIDVADEQASGRLVFAEARDAISTFMVGGMPDRDRFVSSIGGIIVQLVALAESGGVRAYGEMVDLLWRDGNPQAALHLEELWNELGQSHSFSLLCAYPLGNFYKESHTEQFEEICRTHERIIPAETIEAGDPHANALKISVLQQRARALEAEIAHRKELEHALREALSDQKRLEEASRKASEENAFLLEATTALNRSLDYDETVRSVAEIAVPRLGHACLVDVLREDGSRERRQFTGNDSGVDVCEELEAAISSVVASGEWQVFDSGESGHAFICPLIVAGRSLGTITFLQEAVSLPSRAVSSEFARRAAIAIEHARLYRLANEANKIKDQFLATLSHELRTPLTAILGWARMLTLGGLDAETLRTAYATIDRSARTQAALIDDLLDLSRVVTGKLTLRSEPVDLASVIEGALDTVRLAAQTRNVQLEVTRSAERAIVTGDSTRLQQIVWNLLANAVKFSDRGGRVTLTVERNGDTAMIIVCDTGRGISSTFLPHVFEPFRQADGASTRKYGGLGLGLAIVKYLTELHGGSVQAASAGEGKGATFTVTLPLAVRHAQRQKKTVEHEAADLHGVSVLLVDDDGDTLELCAAILRRSGAEVIQAGSVTAARELLARSSPNIVVTDIAMPGEDGFNVLREIRGGAEALRHIPVVALTASSTDSSPTSRLAAFSAHIRKPIDPIELVERLASMV